MAYDTFHLSLTAAPPWSLCSSHTAINTPSLRGLRWRWHLPETLIPCSDARHRKLGSSHFQTHALISSLWTWKMFMVVKTSSLASFKVQLSHLFLLFFLFFRFSYFAALNLSCSMGTLRFVQPETRDRTQAPRIGSVESKPLDYQGSP